LRRIISRRIRLISNGYFLSSGLERKTVFTTPRFLRIKKLRIGIIIVRIKTGRILPALNSRVVYLGVIRK
jgi:hypothetical protein